MASEDCSEPLRIIQAKSKLVATKSDAARPL